MGPAARQQPVEADAPAAQTGRLGLRVHELDHVGVDAPSARPSDSSAASTADSSEEMFLGISLESSQFAA
ncbi:MAG: hypothetical protein DMG82_08920 [Acidobacteria bacterium]|nr:MAG: hypothetical protein DMG82_08920 [Acidobacteriota bacterium]